MIRRFVGYSMDALAAVSLLLCAVAAVGWFFSYFDFAPFGQYRTTSWDGNGSGYRNRGWVAKDGSLHVLRDDRSVDPPPASVPQEIHHTGIDPAPGFRLHPTTFGFAYARRGFSYGEWTNGAPGFRRVTVATSQWSFPLWLPALLFTAPAAARLPALARRRRRRLRGRCLGCGYDLTGNVSGTCPECGRRAARADD